MQTREICLKCESCVKESSKCKHCGCSNIIIQVLNKDNQWVDKERKW